jgi:hypothetical protein
VWPLNFSTNEQPTSHFPSSTGSESRRIEQLVADIEMACQAGRHGWAQAHLADFPKPAADVGQLRRLRELSSEYEKLEGMLKDATRLLKALPERLLPTDPRKTWDEAVAAILEEISLDSVGRLEAFVKFAQQDERERLAKKPLAIVVTPANVADAVGAKELLKQFWRWPFPRLEVVRVDSASSMNQEMVTPTREGE